jgi:uncharacterized membrane protein (Fun14 family)
MRGLSIVSGLATTSILGLATMSVLSVNLATPAYAATSCQRSFEYCDQLVALICGSQTFLGGSDLGNAEDIARIKARSAGYNPDACTVRPLRP